MGKAPILQTASEKLIARHNLYVQKSRPDLPSTGNIAVALGAGPDRTDNGIRMLARLGFLTLADGQPVNTYSLVADYGRFLDGLGFSFHTVTLDDEKQFGIP